MTKAARGRCTRRYPALPLPDVNLPPGGMHEAQGDKPHQARLALKDLSSLENQHGEEEDAGERRDGQLPRSLPLECEG